MELKSVLKSTAKNKKRQPSCTLSLRGGKYRRRNPYKTALSLDRILGKRYFIPEKKIETEAKETCGQEAFTLVELSIVITILALLVAGVIAGTSLISTAKLRAVIGEIESYKVAVDNFKGQYEALPGDIKNATSFWTTTQNGGTAVSNGNGDGQIGVGGTDYAEPYYAWNHLTLSKFVPGTFNGSSATYATIGTNVPASKYWDGLGYSLTYHAGPWSYADALGRLFLNTFLVLGKQSAQAVSYPSTSAFTPADAYYIDSKIDDGTPDFGVVLGGAGVTNSCTSGSAPNIVYDMTITVEGCMFFITVAEK